MQPPFEKTCGTTSPPKSSTAAATAAAVASKFDRAGGRNVSAMLDVAVSVANPSSCQTASCFRTCSSRPPVHPSSTAARVAPAGPARCTRGAAAVVRTRREEGATDIASDLWQVRGRGGSPLPQIFPFM